MRVYLIYPHSLNKTLMYAHVHACPHTCIFFLLLLFTNVCVPDVSTDWAYKTKLLIHTTPPTTYMHPHTHTCTHTHIHVPFFSLSKLYVLSMYSHTHYAPNTCPPSPPPNTHTPRSAIHPTHLAVSSVRRCGWKGRDSNSKWSICRATVLRSLSSILTGPAPREVMSAPPPPLLGPAPLEVPSPAPIPDTAESEGRETDMQVTGDIEKSQPSTASTDSPADEHFSLWCLPANNLNYQGGNAHWHTAVQRYSQRYSLDNSINMQYQYPTVITQKPLSTEMPGTHPSPQS